MKKRLIIPVIAILGALFITNTSCNKKTDVKATVVCKDSLDRLIAGATVQIFANVKRNGATFKADVRAEGVTDSKGQVSFVFKLPAIFDIKATKGTLIGTAIVKVDEPGKVTEKTVIIR